MKRFLDNVIHSEPFVFLKGAIVFLIGPINHQLAYLGVVMVIDLIFGTMAAIKLKVFKWFVLFRKIRSKIIIYSLWIAAFHAFDKITEMSGDARLAVIVILTITEIISAIKNTAKAGHKELAESLLDTFRSLLSPPLPEETEEDDEYPRKRGYGNNAKPKSR